MQYTLHDKSVITIPKSSYLGSHVKLTYTLPCDKTIEWKTTDQQTKHIFSTAVTPGNFISGVAFEEWVDEYLQNPDAHPVYSVSNRA